MKKTIIITASAIAICFAGQAIASETQKYKYDAKGRLIKVERSGTVNNGIKTDYEYDKANNRKKVKVTGSSGTPPS